jgi:hypothetical protein
VINDGLDLVLFFSIDDVRWRSGIHGAVDGVLLDGSKQGYVKYWMYIPRRWKAYLKCNGIDNTFYFEGSVAPWS